MTTQTNPIEAALARVRELREAEKRMTESGWQYIPNTTLDIWTKDGPGYGIVANVAPWCPPYDGPVLEQKKNDANGITALRNAAPTMLGLLEALLTRELAVEACTNSALTNQGHFDVVLESKMDAAIEAVQPALAAFVEGKDGE